MSTDRYRRLDVLCKQLTENIMSTALCAQQVVDVVREMHGDGGRPEVGANGEVRSGKTFIQRPLLDESTLSVVWKGRMLHLGHTQGYWLLARLARSVNRYVTHLDLIQEIWEDEFTDTTTLRAGVRRLRMKLRGGGMGDLANAIVGHHGRYMLSLTRSQRHTNVTRPTH